MNSGLFKAVANFLVICSTLSASINLSDNLIHWVGDVVDFTIPTDIQPNLFGANDLPLGLTVEPASGRIHGQLLKHGEWSTVFFALNGQSLQTKTVRWRVLEAGEEGPFNQSYHVIRTRVGEDLTGIYLGFSGPDPIVVETVSGLPAGLDFNAVTLSFAGSVSEPGLYEIRFSYSRGHATFVHTVAMTVSSAQPEGRISLPDFSSASVIFFKGKYYFPANRESVFVSEDLEVWDEVLTVPGRRVTEMVQTMGALIGICNGGYVISTDG